MKKDLVIIAPLSLVLIYIAYKIIAFFILGSQITQDNVKPKIKLSQIITISEERVKYISSFYLKKDFIGFNAIIDKKYYVTVTKLGKITKDYKIIKTDKEPIYRAANTFHASDDKNEIKRYIDFHNYPLDNSKIYYYSDSVLNINQCEFYEIEFNSNSLGISFDEEIRFDFVYFSFKKNKKSISFIEYEGSLFVLNLFPIGDAQYKSLHDLLQ